MLFLSISNAQNPRSLDLAPHIREVIYVPKGSGDLSLILVVIALKLGYIILRTCMRDIGCTRARTNARKIQKDRISSEKLDRGRFETKKELSWGCSWSAPLALAGMTAAWGARGGWWVGEGSYACCF